jgi:peroxiredoxin
MTSVAPSLATWLSVFTKLPPTVGKLRLAGGVANLATEGDFGASTLHEVATTLAEALREQPQTDSRLYEQLAQLVRYENVKVSLDATPYAEALKKLEASSNDERRQTFTLRDLAGKNGKLSALRGKVVLVNFWATWCPPCRKEMPDLATLHSEFGPRGLVILAISDEELAKVEPFVKQHSYPFPMLLDPGRTVHTLFGVDGIPKSFVYDRDGKLVGTAIDMRTKGQFLAMLAKAGLR